MEREDKEMVIALLSKQVGRAVCEWAKKNGIAEDVVVDAVKSRPSCYVDENGMTHYGDLITVNVNIADDDDYEDD